MPWWSLGLGPLLLTPSQRIPVSQSHQTATAEGTNPPRWSLLGRTESPAAWKREKGPRVCPSGVRDAAQPLAGVSFWSLGEPLKVARTAGSSLHAERPLNKWLHVQYGSKTQGARARPEACDDGCCTLLRRRQR